MNVYDRQQSSERQKDQKLSPSRSDRFSIGQLARLTGITAKAIRYYESIGLLPEPARHVNGYRKYNQLDVNRLILLRRLRLLGVPIPALTSLLSSISDARCIEVQHELLDLVKVQLAALHQEIAELSLLQDQVERYQHQLATCHPDERESFRACHDMSCLALRGEIIPEKEKGDAHSSNI